MEYKLYLSGISCKIERNAFHKTNLENELQNLQNQKENLFKDFDNLISNINIEKLNECIYGLNIGTAELIIKNSDNQEVMRKDLLSIMNEDKLLSKIDILKSKVNLTTIDKFSTYQVNEFFIGEIETPFIEEDKFSIPHLFNYQDFIFFSKLEYKLKTFQLDSLNGDIITLDNYIIKHNSKGYPLYIIFNKLNNIFEPDLFINKYSNVEEYNINIEKLQLYILIESNKYLSLEENIKDFISTHFDINFSDFFENSFGCLINSIMCLVKNEEKEFNIKDLNSIKIKQIKSDKIFLKVDINLNEKITLNKAVFINRFSSLFYKLDNIYCFTKQNDLFNCWTFKNGLLISNDKSYENLIRV